MPREREAPVRVRRTGPQRTAFMHIYGKALTWATETFRLPDGAKAYCVFNLAHLG